MIFIAFVVAAACGGTPTSTPAVTTTAMLAVADNAQLGKILVDGSGRTLYLFEKDKGTTSSCYGDCAVYWPPVLTEGAAIAGAGINASLLGTTRRTDGTTEVTYGGHPLYYVVTDHNPGDTTGQGVNNFGAPWDVVGPDGQQIG